MDQNTKLLCGFLAAPGLPAALARQICMPSPAPCAWMHCPSQPPSHLMSDACREPHSWLARVTTLKSI